MGHADLGNESLPQPPSLGQWGSDRTPAPDEALAERSGEFCMPDEFMEHLDAFGKSADVASQCSPSVDPSDFLAGRLEEGGFLDAPSDSDRERSWYSKYNASCDGSAAPSDLHPKKRLDPQTSESSASRILARPPGGNAASSSEWTDVPAAVAFAHQSLAAPGLEHCWERGVWAEIFGPPRDPYSGMHGTVFKRPEAVLLEDLAAPKAKAAKVGTHSGLAGSTFLNAVRDREAVSWKAKRDNERSEALWLWQELLETWPKNLAVIGQLMKLSCAG